jgi:hypothetical protein
VGTDAGTKEGGPQLAAGGDAAASMRPFRLRMSGRSTSTTSAGRSSSYARSSCHASDESEHVARASKFFADDFADPPEEGVDYPEESSLTSPRRLSLGQALSSPRCGESEHVARASKFFADDFADPPEEGVDYPEESSLTLPRRLSLGQAVSSPRSGV